MLKKFIQFLQKFVKEDKVVVPPTPEPPKSEWKSVPIFKVQSIERAGVPLNLAPKDIEEIEKIMSAFIFQEPEVPLDRGKGGLNHEVKHAIETLLLHYRHHNKVKIDVTLTHPQIKEVLKDIRKLIYAHEGRPMPRE